MMIGNATVIARPYAIAAFESALADNAQGNNALSSWATFLENAVLLIENASMAELLENPAVTKEQLFSLFSELLKSFLNEKTKNFIQLLIENKRLTILPSIALLFKAYCREQEKNIVVQVTSAVALEETYQRKMIQALSSRFKREVSLECNVDPTLLGGIMVQAGDTVIDGSVRGKLTRLLEAI